MDPFLTGAWLVPWKTAKCDKLNEKLSLLVNHHLWSFALYKPDHGDWFLSFRSCSIATFVKYCHDTGTAKGGLSGGVGNGTGPCDSHSHLHLSFRSSFYHHYHCHLWSPCFDLIMVFDHLPFGSQAGASHGNPRVVCNQWVLLLQASSIDIGFA